MTRQFHIYVECPTCGHKMTASGQLEKRVVICGNEQCDEIGKAYYLNMLTGEGYFVCDYSDKSVV